jgi:Zn-dependent protease with chaperone function
MARLALGMASTTTIHLAAVFCGVVLFFTCASPEIGLRGRWDDRCSVQMPLYCGYLFIFIYLFIINFLFFFYFFYLFIINRPLW